MRNHMTLLAAGTLLLAAPASAQVDINKMIQERMQQQGQNGQPGTPSGISVQEDTDPFVANDFVGSFRMELHHFKDGVEEKGSPMNLYYWSSPDKTLIRTESERMEGQDMRVMTDLKGKFQYMMMTDKKGKKTAIKQRKMKVTMDKERAEKEPKVTRTDETRTIDGHLCRKYTGVDEDGTWTGWIAEDMKGAYTDMARNAAKGSERFSKDMREMPGMAMEWEWVSAKGKEKSVGYTRDLTYGEVDESTFSLEGYEVQDMTAFPTMGR